MIFQPISVCPYRKRFLSGLTAALPKIRKWGSDELTTTNQQKNERHHTRLEMISLFTASCFYRSACLIYSVSASSWFFSTVNRWWGPLQSDPLIKILVLELPRCHSANAICRGRDSQFRQCTISGGERATRCGGYIMPIRSMPSPPHNLR